MADNVDVTPGTGATIATDDVGGFQHQRVKISLGPDGSATDALGGAGAVAAGVQRTTLASDDPAVTALQVMDDWDESDRAKVNSIAGQAGVQGGSGTVSNNTQRVVLATDVALPAGENHIGQLGGSTKIVIATPTVSASPDYSIDDVLGGKITLDALGRITNGKGVINFVGVTCDVDIPAGVTIDVVFFHTDPSNSTFTDNSGIAMNVADLHFIAGVAQLNTRLDFGTPAMLIEAAPRGIPFVCASGTDDLFAVMIVRNAATLNLAGTADINLIVGALQD